MYASTVRRYEARLIGIGQFFLFRSVFRTWWCYWLHGKMRQIGLLKWSRESGGPTGARTSTSLRNRERCRRFEPDSVFQSGAFISPKTRICGLAALPSHSMIRSLLANVPLAIRYPTSEQRMDV